MIRYVLSLTILLALGITLVVKLSSQEQQLDETVFLSAIKSINELDSMDKDLSLLVSKSQFNTEVDHQNLLTTNNQISDGFDDLRFDTLLREIANNTSLEQSIKKFEALFLQREEELEAYIQTNIDITDSLRSVAQITQKLQDQNLGKAGPTIRSVLGNTNATIYSLALSNTHQPQFDSVSSSLSTIIEQLGTDVPDIVAQALSVYNTHVKNVFANQQRLHQQLALLESLRLTKAVQVIEYAYTSAHQEMIANLTLLKNALIAYALFFLAAILFCAYKIHKHINLIAQKTIVTADEIHSSVHLAASRVDAAKRNLYEFEQVVNELESLSITAQTTKADNKTLNQQLLNALQKFQEINASELLSNSKQSLRDSALSLTKAAELTVILKDTPSTKTTDPLRPKKRISTEKTLN